MNRGPEKLGRLIGAIVVIGLFLLLSGCGVYQVSTTPKVKITKVLTITSTGDTLAVPIKQFQKYNYNNVFDNYRFNYNYGFGWYNHFYPFNYGYNYPWYRPNSWYYRDFYYKPSYSLELPQLNKPRVIVNGRRGSNNSGGSSRGNNIIIKPNNNNNNISIGRDRGSNRIYLRNPNNNQNNLNNINNPPPVVRPNIQRGSNFSSPPPVIRNNSTSSSGRGNINRKN